MPGGKQLAVVTGASTGMGEVVARRLATQGFHVLAGVRKQADADKLRSPGVEPVIVDVTNQEQIDAVATRVAEDGERRPLGVLVNNAGLSVNAPVEGIPMEEWRRQFDVNFFGQVAVTQALLPALLTSRGRIVNISSIGGRVALPTFGAYAASKFALEAMSDSLRREVSKFGVDVIVIEPGAIKTPIWDKGAATADGLIAQMSPETRARYSTLEAAMRKQVETVGKTAVSAEAAADVIVGAITAPKPKTRYTIGRDAGVMSRLVRVVPDRVLDRLIARNLGY